MNADKRGWTRFAYRRSSAAKAVFIGSPCTLCSRPKRAARTAAAAGTPAYRPAEFSGPKEPRRKAASLLDGQDAAKEPPGRVPIRQSGRRQHGMDGIAMSLTDREKEQLKATIDAGEPLPPKYRAVLFAEPH